MKYHISIWDEADQLIGSRTYSSLKMALKRIGRLIQENPRNTVKLEVV